MTSFYICKKGKIVPQDYEKSSFPKPSIIPYKHMVRQIFQSPCKCKQQIDTLSQTFHSQIAQKDKEISALINRISEKEVLIQRLQSDLFQIKLSKTPFPLKDQGNLQLEDGMRLNFQKTINSTVVSSFSLGEISSASLLKGSSDNANNKAAYDQLEECYKKTTILMREMDGIMKKKRKYQFYNPVHVRNSIVEELQNSFLKDKDQKSFQKQQNSNQTLQIDNKSMLPHSEFTDFDSLDLTTFQSLQNVADEGIEEAFYSKLLKDSIQLSNLIIRSKEESILEIRQLQDFYQQQLKILYDELQKERNKNSFINIAKEKLNEISLKGRRALAEFDQNADFLNIISEKGSLPKNFQSIKHDDSFRV